MPRLDILRIDCTS